MISELLAGFNLIDFYCEYCFNSTLIIIIMNEKEPLKTGAKRLLWRVARLLLIGFIAVLSLLFFFQTWLIFPGRATQGKDYAVLTAPKGSELVSLTTRSGIAIKALFGAALNEKGEVAADAATRPTLLYFYGNGMCLRDCLIEFNSFRKLGVNVLIPEYVGYGMSGGSPGEQNCYETADAAYDYLLTRTDIAPNKIVPAGWSLGSAVAIDLASRRPVAALAVFSAFSSMSEMARLVYPFLPAAWILQHKFESKQKLSTVRCPVFIAHGRRDSLIPFRMSDELAAAAAGSVSRHDIDGADHADIFEVGGPDLFKSLGNFLRNIK